MILTGRAKNDFYSSTKEGNLVNMMDDVYLYALIIEWFDSVGYFIEITKDRYITEQWVNNVERFPLYKSRQEATKQAIIKANQIYNESKN